MNKTQPLSDQKRSAIALLFMVACMWMSMVSPSMLTVILRTILFLAAFIILVPIFRKKYHGTRDWKTFLFVSGLGITVFLASSVMHLMKL